MLGRQRADDGRDIPTREPSRADRRPRRGAKPQRTIFVLDMVLEKSILCVMADGEKSEAPLPVPQQMSLERYAQITREMIVHEDQLINNRMSWLTTLQGLLYATRAMSRLLQAWLNYKEEHSNECYTGPDVIGLAPSRGVPRYLAHWVAVPLIFVAAWVGILLIALSAPIPLPSPAKP